MISLVLYVNSTHTVYLSDRGLCSIDTVSGQFHIDYIVPSCKYTKFECSQTCWTCHIDSIAKPSNMHYTTCERV